MQKRKEIKDEKEISEKNYCICYDSSNDRRKCDIERSK